MTPTAIWLRRRIAVALIGTVAAVAGIVVVAWPASSLVAQDWCTVLPFWPGCRS
jgi:uncharacterized membrane protein HdeD (DUF308 family)